MERLRKVSYLGYQTKIAILFVFALITGSTVNSVLGAIIGGISNGVAGAQAEKRAALAAQAQQAAQVQQAQQAAQAQQAVQTQQFPSAGPPSVPPDDEPVVATAPQEVAYWRDVNWRNMVTAYLGLRWPSRRACSSPSRAGS